MLRCFGVKIIALAAAVLAVTGGYAQVRPIGNPHYLLDVWTSDEGLPDSSVTSIVQTPDGYLWIGTHNGLVRFDGVRFVVFDPINTPALKHARVLALFVDARGTLWINTYGGAMTSLLDGVFTHQWSGGQVSAVFSQSDRIYFALLRGELVYRDAHPPGTNHWRSVALDGVTHGNFFQQDRSGTIWYHTRDGAAGRVIGTNALPLPADHGLQGSNVSAMTSDSQGRIWVATEREIAMWDGRRFEDQTASVGTDGGVSMLLATRTNGCWVLSPEKFSLLQGKRWKLEVKAWRQLAESAFYIDAYEDRNGGVWLRHFGQGLFHVRPDGSTQRITSTNGLPGDRVSSWLEDREGNIWVGVERGGLVRLRERRFRVVGPAEGLANSAVSSVCEDSAGDVWIATFGGGLNRWRNNSLERFDLPSGAYRGSFFSVFPAAPNRLWISAGREDLTLMEDGRIVPAPEAVHGIKALHAAADGAVWMGYQTGLARWHGGVLSTFGPADGFDSQVVRALTTDAEGNVWIGTGNGTLIRYSHGSFVEFRPDDGIEAAAIWSLLADPDGTVWLGTFRGGLLRFRDGVFRRFTTQHGLPNDIICQLLDDGNGNLWIGSRRGIFSLARESIDAFESGGARSLSCVAYGLYDGLPTLECSGSYQPSCWKAKDGTLWFATVKGAVSIQPRNVSRNEVPPPVAIEEMWVDGRMIQLRAGASTASPVQVPPGKHQLEFRFTALSFAAPDKVRFRYRLGSESAPWLEAGGDRSARYSSLTPGEYRFEVIACNNDGVWSSPSAHLAFEILPHAWETWWFQGMVGVVLLGGSAMTMRYAATRNLKRKVELLKHQRALQRDRERIARDIHDDLGAGLTQIILQSGLARREDPAKTESHFAQIGETARDLVRTMDEIVWAVDPENDTLDGLATYVGKYVHDFVSVAGLRCRLNLPATLPGIAVSADVRHNLFLAIKETLNNVVKHAGATEVSLQLVVDPPSISFVIRDNGHGFQSEEGGAAELAGLRASAGHGMRNITARLEQIGGQAAVRSKRNEGTEVELTVVIQNGAAG